MDVRGSGGEELSREYQPAWNLGHYEALDYLSITKYMLFNFKTHYINNTKTIRMKSSHCCVIIYSHVQRVKFLRVDNAQFYFNLTNFSSNN